MLDVIANMGVSFPLFCLTSLNEIHEKWRIRGEFGIKIPAWPVRNVRALLSLDITRINEIDRIQIKTKMYRCTDLSRYCASRLLFIRVIIIINPCASRCRSVAHSRLLFPRRARRNTQEVACARSCNSVATLSREGSARSSNVCETSCSRRVIEHWIIKTN